MGRWFLICLLPLAACGVADVATTAATTGKMQAEQAKQGQQAVQKVQTELDAAAKAAQERAAAAEGQ
ncbi:hypothetical protein [Propionivibrio soli]|jgi:hypothetical protein|uniref:hypothetical protein n=1 Tax=Propionivibrio soli TaxID=2976531 RepID=UPI0021E7F7D4|nr:hypothetical protein [Propionivibrio soli]